MLIIEIKQILMTSQQNYRLFSEIDKIQESERWLKNISNIPDTADIPVAYNKGDDIVETLNANIICFREYLNANSINSKKDIEDAIETQDESELDAEGFQIVDESDFEPEFVAQHLNIAENNYSESENTESDHAHNINEAEEQIRQMYEHIEILQNTVAATEEENRKLHEMLEQAQSRLAEVQDEFASISSNPYVESQSSLSSRIETTQQEAPQTIYSDRDRREYAPEELTPAGKEEDEDDFSYANNQQDQSESTYHDDDEPETNNGKKKLTKEKKIKIAIAVILAVVAITATLMLDAKKKNTVAPAALPQQHQAEPAFGPAVQPQVSSAAYNQMPEQNIAPAAPVQPTLDTPKAQLKTEPEKKSIQVPATVQNNKTEKKAAKGVQVIKYSKSGIPVEAAPGKPVRIYLQSNEVLREVLGEDTDNWIVTHDTKSNSVLINPKNKASKTSILIDTSHRAYTINLSINRQASIQAIKIQ
jgi:regulator of replication initiation timing